jgi:PIN domain nuclease of toxin-antitoxin system
VKRLLDTHAVLSWLSGDPRLGVHARDLITDSANDVFVTVATFWEIVVKVRAGKLQADIGAIMEAGARDGFRSAHCRPAAFANACGSALASSGSVRSHADRTGDHRGGVPPLPKPKFYEI